MDARKNLQKRKNRRKKNERYLIGPVLPPVADALIRAFKRRKELLGGS